jgi:hypothetical protein
MFCHLIAGTMPMEIAYTSYCCGERITKLKLLNIHDFVTYSYKKYHPVFVQSYTQMSIHSVPTVCIYSTYRWRKQYSVAKYSY